MVKELSDGVTETQILQKLWKKWSLGKTMIMVWERYCYASPKPEFFLFSLFNVYIFIHISANMSPFGLKFSQMILHTETSELMYNWSFIFVVLHKPTLLPSAFNQHTPACTLRSSSQCLLSVQLVKIHNNGNRAFSASAPVLWDSLLININ